MESVGQKLREARLRLGFALEQVSAATRINIKNLQAIEDDDLKQISSPFLYRSFVRQFAASVNLGGEDLQAALQKAAESMPEPLVPGQAGAPVRPDLPGLRPQRTRKLRWMFSISSLVLILVGCSSLYGVWQTSRDGAHNTLAGFLALFKTKTQAEVRSTAKREVAAPQPAPDLNPADQAPDASAAIDGFRIQLSALETTWLSVMTDGKKVYQGVLLADESKTLEGRETARIRTGNAGGVEVVFNGRDIGPLGRKGQVRTVMFNKNGYETIEPQAAAQLRSSDWANGRRGFRLLAFRSLPVGPFQTALLSFKNN